MCGRELKPDTVQSVVDTVMALPEGTRFAVAFPLRLSSKVTHDVVVENLRAQGFVRVSVDGRIVHLDDVAAEGLNLTRVRELLVVVDRLTVGPDAAGRIADAVGTAFREGDGDCVVVIVGTGNGEREPNCDPRRSLFRFPMPRSRVPPIH